MTRGKVVGIIAEYDPFHRGHAYHLQQAKRLADAEYAVVVMSCCFTQRGDAALLSPACRTRMALRNGADAVIALPAMWSVRDAEHFALGGISLLKDMHVDAVSFGSQCGDLDTLRHAAQMIEHPEDMLAHRLHELLDKGLPHPEAMQQAIGERDPQAGQVLQTPNNTLAVCYLRAMLRFGWQPEVYPVARHTDYHAAQVEEMPSASAIRDAILQGSWRRAERALPQNSIQEVLHAGLNRWIHRPQALNAVLTACLCNMGNESLNALPDISEGIQCRLQASAADHYGRQHIVDCAAVRRYPKARLNRLCTHALLGMTQADISETPLPPAALLLGVRQGAEKVLSIIAKADVPVLGRAAEYPRDQRWLQIQDRAWQLWSLGTGVPVHSLWTNGVQRVAAGEN